MGGACGGDLDRWAVEVEGEARPFALTGTGAGLLV